MTELRYPNESREYRDARDSLLKDEQELVDKVKAVAAKRRNLPLGGRLKEDYVFQWANEGKVGKSVKFSELFADKRMSSALQCFQNSREAMRAPSTIAAIFAHTTSGSTAACPTHVPNPQSLPAITFSLPTSFA
jgi:predicted dithiol-disulfide oxidoreductase (DUF899 family)